MFSSGPQTVIPKDMASPGPAAHPAPSCLPHSTGKKKYISYSEPESILVSLISPCPGKGLWWQRAVWA